jgi:hypothetical protein
MVLPRRAHGLASGAGGVTRDGDEDVRPAKLVSRQIEYPSPGEHQRMGLPPAIMKKSI